MVKTTNRAMLMLLVMILITGIAYPLAITGLAQVFFHKTANGSILSRNSLPVGSALIGQNFTSARYFHGRPSAAGKGYDAASSSGSNLGPTNKFLLNNIAERIAKVRTENNLRGNTPVPSDLVTASASGLDPDISPEAALLQVPRVAQARNLQESRVRDLVERCTDGRQLGILGEPRVNVLKLNLTLDKL
jgi:potassium-transporting ATPase KdpC subunit